MTVSLFVNLPVADLAAARAFYEALGFTINPDFSDETAACVVLSETNYVMLLTHDKMRQFTALPLGDARAQTQHLLAISCEDRAGVDAMVARGLTAGGSEPRPVQDMGFMYSRALADPDGHIWEPFFYDLAAAPDGGE